MASQVTNTQSVSELLDALLNKQADSAVVNPPTEGPGAGKPDSEEKPTEGPRAQEHDAFIRETLGDTGAESTISPDTNTGMPNTDMLAAPKLPTGEDPENENHGLGTPSGVEPGTSLSGATVSEKEASVSERIANWRKASAELMLELVDGDNKPATKQADSKTTAVETLTEGDDKLAAELEQQVVAKLAAAHLEGRQIARTTLGVLSELQKQADDQAKQTKVAKAKKAMADVNAKAEKVVADANDKALATLQEADQKAQAILDGAAAARRINETFSKSIVVLLDQAEYDEELEQLFQTFLDYAEDSVIHPPEKGVVQPPLSLQAFIFGLPLQPEPTS
jgi:hypothetical protein